jgi:hypothetical protein
MPTKAPGGEWDRVENRGTESHTFELAWWSETEAVEKAAMAAGPGQAGRGSDKGEKE